MDEDIMREYGDNIAILHANGYVSIQFSRSRKPRRRELLHRFIVPGYKVVHHKNNNKLDNRRENLMGTDQSFNQLVKVLNTDDTTRGTRLHKSGRWQARLYINRKETSLGYFNTQEEAREAYLAGYAKLVSDRLEGHER